MVKRGEVTGTRRRASADQPPGGAYIITKQVAAKKAKGMTKIKKAIMTTLLQHDPPASFRFCFDCREEQLGFASRHRRKKDKKEP